MTVGPIGQSQISNGLRIAIVEAARFGEHKGVYKGTVELKTLPRKMGRDWNESAMPPLTAVAVTADEEYDSPQQISDQKITITPAEVIVQVEYGMRAFETSIFNPSMLGEAMAAAIERKRDIDGLGQFDNFGATLGSTSTTLTADLIAKGAVQVRSGRAGSGGTARTGALTTGDPPESELFAVFHTYNEFDILSQFNGLGGAPTQVTTSAAVMNFAGNTISDWMAKWIERGNYVGRIAGATFLTDGNFTMASSAIKGGVYARSALIHVTFTDYEEKRPWYSKDERFVTLTATADYGNGERLDVGGIEVAVDTSALV